MADVLSASIFIGESVSQGTSGSILYVDVNGHAAQDNAHLFYDAVNLKVTITGTISAQQRLAFDGTHNYDFTVDSVGRYNLNGTDITWIRKAGATVPSSAWYFTNLVLTVSGEETSGGGTIIGCQHADNSAGDSYEFTGYRSGGTLSAPTAVQLDWRLGRYAAVGHNGTAFFYTSSFDIYAGENWTATKQGSYATIRCTPLGSITGQQVARFNGDGSCSLLSTCQVGDGSNTAMSFGFNSATGGIPGFYKYGAGFLGFASVSGRADMVFGQQNFYMIAGTTLKWSSGTTDAGTSIDTTLTRGAAGRVDIGGTAQQVRILHDGTNGTIDVSTGKLILGGTASDIQYAKALVSLGGGAAPTFGTIGGSGPTAAAQNAWKREVDSTGAPYWVPIWK